MPIEVGLWRVDGTLQPISFEPMNTEARLEEILADHIDMIAPHLMVIGRQVQTPHGNRIDLVAIGSAGSLAVVELKKDKTPRDIVAQILDYGSWISTLRDDDIARIYNDYLKRWRPAEKQSINEAFCERFGVKAMPEELNAGHELIIVASSLDAATERIVGYLAMHHDIEINASFFRFFRDGNREYLSRAWLIEPSIQAVAEPEERGQWNGEYYVSFGAGEVYDWEEARKYGFICGGGGLWYSNTLQMLEAGDRVWVNIPATGYVGVAEVLGPRVPLDEFMTRDNTGNEVRIVDLPLKIAKGKRAAADPDLAEYLVPVKWLKTVPASQAIKERGFFGNQNTVARPIAPRWNHTVDRLKQRFGIS